MTLQCQGKEVNCGGNRTNNIVMLFISVVVVNVMVARAFHFNGL